LVVSSAETRKELCMVISTVDRPGARYLLQSTASILEGLSEKQLKKSQLLIVNTGAPTYSHTPS
jgi:hypothetical protein